MRHSIRGRFLRGTTTDQRRVDRLVRSSNGQPPTEIAVIGRTDPTLLKPGEWNRMVSVVMVITFANVTTDIVQIDAASDGRIVADRLVTALGTEQIDPKAAPVKSLAQVGAVNQLECAGQFPTSLGDANVNGVSLTPT